MLILAYRGMSGSNNSVIYRYLAALQLKSRHSSCYFIRPRAYYVDYSTALGNFTQSCYSFSIAQLNPRLSKKGPNRSVRRCQLSFLPLPLTLCQSVLTSKAERIMAIGQGFYGNVNKSRLPDRVQVPSGTFSFSFYRTVRAILRAAGVQLVFCYALNFSNNRVFNLNENS